MMANLTQDHDHVRSAIDDCLSGVDQMPSLRADIMRKAKGDVKVKRKLSVGLVLLVVLVITVVTALAAIALNALYENAMQKEGESGLIQDWSAADQVALVDWMIDAGIELDTDKVAQLQATSLSEQEKSTLAMEIITEYYPARDGILTTVDMIAKEKGPIEYWSLEDKAWFSQMLQTYQPEEVGSVNLLPDEDAITQAEAIEIMYAYYQEEHGLSRDAFDESKMAISFSEGTWDDGSGPERLTTWSMDLWLKDDPDHPMGISILPDGTIKQASGPYVSTWRDEWYDTFIGDSLGEEFWTIEGTYAFQQSDWAQRVAALQSQGETINGTLLHLLTKHFGLPGETDVSPDEALQAANLAMLNAWNLSTEDLHYYQVRKAYLLDDYEYPVYFFWYLQSRNTRALDQDAKDRLIQAVVLVNATDGSIVTVKSTGDIGFKDIL